MAVSINSRLVRWDHEIDVVDVPRYLIDVPSSIRSAKALCHNLGIMDGWPLQGPHSFNLTSGLRCHLTSHLGSGLFSGRDDHNSLNSKRKVWLRLRSNYTRTKVVEPPQDVCGPVTMVFDVNVHLHHLLTRTRRPNGGRSCADTSIFLSILLWKN